MNRIPVLFLAGTNDRAIVACIRSLVTHNIPFHICLPESRIPSRWALSGYRDHILNERYNASGSPTSFKSSLQKVLKKIGPTVLFPTGETFIRILLQDPSWLKQNGVIFPVVSYKMYKTVSDKASFTRLVTEYGINIPLQLDHLPHTFTRPFVAKPKSNVDYLGDKKVPYLILSNRDFSRFKQSEPEDQFFYQDYIDGYSIYYCAIYRHGREQCSFIQKNLRQQPGGKSIFRACPTTICDDLRNKITGMLHNLKWDGVIMIEFKVRQDEYYMIEANPRFWGPLQLCVDNGYDFPCYLYFNAVGEAPTVISTKNSPGFCYSWSLGYLYGLIGGLSHGGMFQTTKTTYGEKKLKCKDVWLRGDTFGVFLWELLLGLALLARAMVYRIKQVSSRPVVK